MFDVVKDLYKSILARTDTRYTLGVIGVSNAHMPHERDAHLEENADSGKNGIRRWEYLSHSSEGRFRAA